MQTNTPQPAPTLHEQELQRRANRDTVRGAGFEPYGVRQDDLATVAAARAAFDEGANDEHNAKGKEPGHVDRRPVVRTAGRVMLHRDGGKLIWMQLRDHTGDVQVAVSQRDVPSEQFTLAKNTDLGDILIAEGRVMKTKTGEVTVWASSLVPGAKCLVPPPDKHAGLADIELRYRQRYVDMWVNPETRHVLEARSAIVREVRGFMDGRGYLEVETPMLQTLAGGAAARPFVTKMNALDINLFMRIAPELYLKRLLVGGMPKVYEINRNFRNEGLDKQHNPEFTMLEAYHAFGDVEVVMELTESLVRACAGLVSSLSLGGRAGEGLAHAGASCGSPTSPPAPLLKERGDVVLPFGDLSINYSRPFARVSYAALFHKAYGFDMGDSAKARALLKSRRAAALHAAIDVMDPVLVVNELFEDKQHGGEAQLDHATPTFITDYPAAISPLTRPKRDNPVLSDRADLFIAGMEIAPHYTELNDPDIQEQKFREQLRGLDADKTAEESTFRTMDHDFLRALKVGMPPAGGMGLGIDRLVMLLTNQRTIRDVVLFPMMRPE
jgi:lysyl-tRNA synthetase class 2